MTGGSQLSNLLGALCAVPSPSGSEAAVGQLVKDRLSSLGIDWIEDDGSPSLGGDCGNLFALVPAADGSTSGGVLLCAHLDTVPPVGTPEAVLSEGYWRNGGDGILGIDNKAAVAAILIACERFVATPPPVPVEILFTVGEEVALEGAKAFDRTRLNSACAFFFDHPTPIGTVVTTSPGHHRLEMEFVGVAAHAGVAPLDGRSAIRAAAIAVASSPGPVPTNDATANIGVISGGTAINVVPERCTFTAEVRAVDPEVASQLVAQFLEAGTSAANEVGVKLDVETSKTFDGYRHSSEHLASRVARRALGDLGVTCADIASGGGSDANVFEARGLSSVNLGDGSLDTHTSQERIAADDLERLYQLVCELPAAAKAELQNH